MKSPYFLYCVVYFALVSTTAATAQRPRTISNDPSAQGKAEQPQLPPPPPSVKAKYEGGVIGYNKKEDGELSFDDANERLVFRDKLNKERISIPLSTVNAAYGDTRSLQPAAATVISNIPSIYALPARFFKQKYQYLTLQYSDPDNGVSAITSFKLENKEILASELVALAQKAGLSLRGDGYVRKKKAPEVVDNTANNGGSDYSTISGGVLNGKATALPRPDYPDAARQSKAAGTVTVQVTVDEQGFVVDAKAVNGDAMLYDAAEAAARKAKFAPAVYNGRHVKVIGVLNYTFVL